VDWLRCAPPNTGVSVPMNIEEKFISLIENLIFEAEATKVKASESGKSWLIESCDLTIKNMNHLKGNVLAGKIPKSGGAGLGVSRAFSEWDVPKNLYNAGHKLDAFYMYEYNI